MPKSSLKYTDPQSEPETAALNEFFSAAYPGLSPREKIYFIRSFAEFFKGLVEKHGMFPAEDLPGLEVRAVGDGWDFRYCKRKSGKGWGRFLLLRKPDRSLAHLYSHFLTTASRNERLRFFRQFHGQAARLRDSRARLQWIDQVAINTARKRWRKVVGQSLGSNERFVAERLGNFRIHRLRDPLAEKALSLLLPDPDHFLGKGKSLGGRGIGCSSAKITIDGRSYFLKRYDCRGMVYRLKNIFRRSRALRVWRTTWGFLARGLPVPTPVLFLEERHFRLLGRAYILSEFHDDTRRLMDLWPKYSEREQRAILVNSGKLIGTLHRFGCIHGDTNWDNLLVPGGEGELLMVDLDCGRLTRWLSFPRAYKDIQHFLRDLFREKNAGRGKEGIFIETWRRWYK